MNEKDSQPIVGGSGELANESSMAESNIKKKQRCGATQIFIRRAVPLIHERF